MRYAALSAAFLLASCAAQDIAEGAGQSRVDVDVGLAEPGQVPYIRTVRIVDGKERDLGRVVFRFVDGKPEVEYRGNAERAFEGQRSAADMVAAITSAIAAAGVQVTPAIVDGIAKAIGKP